MHEHVFGLVDDDEFVVLVDDVERDRLRLHSRPACVIDRYLDKIIRPQLVPAVLPAPVHLTAFCLYEIAQIHLAQGTKLPKQEVFEPHFVMLVASRDVYARFHPLIVPYHENPGAEAHSIPAVFLPLPRRLRYNFVGKMKLDHIDLLARSASAFVDGTGLRTGAKIVVENIASGASADIAFIVRGRADGGVADCVAAHGLGVADFRRLESRITKSSLWRIFQLSTPLAIDDLAVDNALNFLAFGTGTRFLVAVPVVLRGTTVGMIAAGFGNGEKADENFTIKLLGAFAPIVAQAMLVERAADEQSRKLVEENIHLKHELREKYDLSNLIGNSGPMRTVFDQVRQIARTNSTILLRGESGTGKEMIAGAIHYNSLRSKRPFVKVNCSAQPQTSIDAELFGVSQGGKRLKKGKLEAADGGTIFLDEIAELPLNTQIKLHRALRDRVIEHGHGNSELPINVRVLIATTKDLDVAVNEGSFHVDLFDAIRPFSIFLPPLRERKSDILLLAEHFLDTSIREHKKDVRRISTPAIDMLTAYHFPGNVRELENVIDLAVRETDSNVIHGHHLPPTLQTAEVSGTETRVTLASAVEAFERDMIIDTLKSTRGNVAKAAIMLDSTERILGYKIVKYEIDRKRFRR